MKKRILRTVRAVHGELLCTKNTVKAPIFYFCILLCVLPVLILLLLLLSRGIWFGGGYRYPMPFFFLCMTEIVSQVLLGCAFAVLFGSGICRVTRNAPCFCTILLIFSVMRILMLLLHAGMWVMMIGAVLSLCICFLSMRESYHMEMLLFLYLLGVFLCRIVWFSSLLYGICE